jgi:hypothetical protein
MKTITVLDMIPLLDGKKWVTIINNKWMISMMPHIYPEKFKVIRIDTNVFNDSEADISLIVEEIAE